MVRSKNGGSTLRSLRTIAGAVALYAGLSGTAHTATLNPGDSYTVYFSAAPSSADLLFFETNWRMKFTGAPVITGSVYDGKTLLGSYDAPAQTNGFQDYAEFAFKSASSPYTYASPTVIDFTNLDNGTINGKLVLTVTGGSLQDLDSGFFASTGTATGSSGYRPNLNVTPSDTPVASSSAPEPTTISLFAMAGIGLLAFNRRRR